MKWVKAIHTGYYGSRKERGEKFVVPDDFDAKWAVEADAPMPEDDVKEPNILDGTIDEILSALSSMSDADVQNILSAEIAGKTRKGLISKLQDEVANRADAAQRAQTSDDGVEAREAQALAQRLNDIATHDEADKLAAEESVIFGPQIKTVADKKKAISEARAEKALLS